MQAYRAFRVPLSEFSLEDHTHLTQQKQHRAHFLRMLCWSRERCRGDYCTGTAIGPWVEVMGGLSERHGALDRWSSWGSTVGPKGGLAVTVPFDRRHKRFSVAPMPVDELRAQARAGQRRPSMLANSLVCLRIPRGISPT